MWFVLIHPSQFVWDVERGVDASKIPWWARPMRMPPFWGGRATEGKREKDEEKESESRRMGRNASE